MYMLETLVVYKFYFSEFFTDGKNVKQLLINHPNNESSLPLFK